MDIKEFETDIFEYLKDIKTLDISNLDKATFINYALLNQDVCPLDHSAICKDYIFSNDTKDIYGYLIKDECNCLSCRNFLYREKIHICSLDSRVNDYITFVH